MPGSARLRLSPTLRWTTASGSACDTRRSALLSRSSCSWRREWLKEASSLQGEPPETAASAEPKQQQQVDWSAASLPLNPVLGPTDHSLRLMMPVIVFAIIRGFDELLPVLPPLVSRVPSLENLLVVDLGDNVTLNVRPHQMHSLRQLWATRMTRSSRPLGVSPDAFGSPAGDRR